MFFLVFKQCSECQQDVLIFGACADEKIVNSESIGLTFENPSKFIGEFHYKSIDNELGY